MNPGWIRPGRTLLLVILLGLSAVAWTGIVSPIEETSGYTVMGGGVNGNQEIMADPNRPCIYYVDPVGSTLTFLDTETDQSESIEVGDAPMSVDISPDGSSLYVSISGENKIVVVSIDLREVTREIALDFSPLSVRIGRPDRLYATCMDETLELIRIIDEGTGAVENTISVSYTCALEVSPDGDTLIAVSLGTSPVKVSKYSIMTDNAHLSAEDDHDLGSNFQQMAVDWANDRLYLASGAPYGLETLSLDTLDRIGFLPMAPYPRTLALAANSSIVCGVSETPYDCSLFIFNTTTEALLAEAALDPHAVMCVLPNDLYGIYLASELLESGLRRVDFGPMCIPSSPAQDSVLGYAPEYVSYTVQQGILVSTPPVMNMTVDGSQHIAWANTMDRYFAELSSSLAPGPHEVSVPVAFFDSTKWFNWSFVIDPESETAVTPSVEPYQPDPNSDLALGTFIIRARVEMPDPAPISYSVTIEMDGELLATELDESVLGMVYKATVYDPTTGTHEATAAIAWDLGNESCSWSFTVRIFPSITAVTPQPDSFWLTTVSRISVTVDLGEPRVTIESAEITVDGELALHMPLFSDDDTFVWSPSQPVGPGVHTLSVNMQTDIGMQLSRVWSFEVSDAASMRVYSHPTKGYNISAPTTWDASIDEQIEGTVLDFTFRGPMHDDFLTNIIVASDTDSQVEETNDYLVSQYELTLAELEDEGIRFWVAETPSLFTVSTHLGLRFAIEWNDYDIKQTVAIIADERRDLQIAITLSSSGAAHDRFLPVFHAVVDSLLIDDPAEDDGPLLSPDVALTLGLAAAMGIGAVVAVIVAVLVVAPRRRGNRGDAPVHPLADPQEGVFCIYCGSRVAPGATSCSNCGREIPPNPGH